MYKDKDKQRQAQREAMKRYRGKQGITEQGITNGVSHITDACGTKHKIDYETRRKNHALLKAWAEGKGTPGQRVMGQLAMTYNVGIDLNSYLGHT